MKQVYFYFNYEDYLIIYVDYNGNNRSGLFLLKLM